MPHPPPADGMSWVPGGAFLMGSEDFDPEERPVPGGSFPPNGFGLYDVGGNVWKWTSIGFRCSSRT